jgi:hypothetical protein
MSVYIKNTRPPIRIGHPMAVLLHSWLLRHIDFFDHPLGLMLDWELVDFAVQHPEFLPNILGDSDNALHFEKLRDLEAYISLFGSESVE